MPPRLSWRRHKGPSVGEEGGRDQFLHTRPQALSQGLLASDPALALSVGGCKTQRNVLSKGHARTLG